MLQVSYNNCTKEKWRKFWKAEIYNHFAFMKRSKYLVSIICFHMRAWKTWKFSNRWLSWTSPCSLKSKDTVISLEKPITQRRRKIQKWRVRVMMLGLVEKRQCWRRICGYLQKMTIMVPLFNSTWTQRKWWIVHPEIQVCIVPFKKFFRKCKEGKFGPKVAPKNFTPPKSVRFKITLFFIIHVTAFY